MLLPILLLIASVATAAPWVADLSEVADAGGQQSVDLWLPAGEWATVGVYEAESVEVDAPGSVMSEVLVQHMGASHTEEQVPIPYWLPPLRWRPPDQSGNPYAVRLHPTEVGDFTVGIKCQDGTDLSVDLHATAPVPGPDFAVGYYTAASLWTYMNWRECFEQLRDMRCNTFTVYPQVSGRAIPEGETETAARNVAWQLDLAVEVGLIDGTQPVFIMHCNPPDIDEATKYGKHVDRWPELLGYGKDEAATNADGESQARGMVSMFNRNGKRHYRSGAAMNNASILRFGDGIDIWVCLMADLTDLVKREAARQKKALWSYCCQLRGTNAPLNRYQSGWWAFKNRPEGMLSWTYMDSMLRPDRPVPSSVRPDGTWAPCGYYEYCLDAPDGPISSVGAEARRDGIVDYMVLRELERAILAAELDTDADPERVALAREAMAWLQDNTDQVDVNFWPDDHPPFGNCVPPEPCHWDTVDMAAPALHDFSALRRQAIEYTQRLQVP